MRSLRSPALRLGLPTLFAVCAGSGNARADSAAWFQLGGGGTVLTTRSSTSVAPTLDVLTGFGTDPAASWALGPVLRFQYHGGQGVELTPALRVAQGAYTRGSLGVAFDLGPWFRLFDGAATGAQVAVSVGGPWGTVATIHGAFANDTAHAVGLLVGFDLLRLTVFRESGENYWPNPFPSPRRDAEGAVEAPKRSPRTPQPPAAQSAPSPGTTVTVPAPRGRKRVLPSAPKPLVDPNAGED
jgi:hypothetical protein